MDVLVVDDESIARQSIAQTLSAAGYRVTTASDGQAAWELLQRAPHQLVVSDWGMPRMDGVELCRKIRSSDGRRYVYFILLTCHGETQDAIRGLEAGADDYIKKPFDPAELVMRVNTARRIIGLETRGMTVFALAKLAESRDTDTGEHLERVRSYCRILAGHLQKQPKFQSEIDDEFVQLIYETSPLHDIGKVAIPDAILLKPGKLTAAEFQVMKTHALHGAETLDAALKEFPNARFLQTARDIALSHHEKFDGSGYPHGLAGRAIPLCGRIVALADVYDAMTSRRPYKKAWTHRAARTYIVEQRGRHFDPDVVSAFVAEEARFLDVLKQLSDEAVTCRDAGAAAGAIQGINPDEPDRPRGERPRRYRALIVDDEAIARKMLVFALESEEFLCDSAASVEQAARLLESNHYDLAVVDLRMPQKNGHILAVDLLQRTDRPAVIVHTAVDHPRMTEDLLARGVDDIAYKPASYPTLAVRARVLVDARRRNGSSAPGGSDKTPGSPAGSSQRSLKAPARSDRDSTGEAGADFDDSPTAGAELEIVRLAAAEDSTTEEIVAAVESDPELAAEMLKIGTRGNDSPPPRAITSVRELVVHLGRRRVGELALLAASCASGDAEARALQTIGAGFPK